MKNRTTSASRTITTSERPSIFTAFDQFIENEGVTENYLFSLPALDIKPLDQSKLSKPTAVSFQNSFIQNMNPPKKIKPSVSIQRGKLENMISFNDHPKFLDSSKRAISLPATALPHRKNVLERDPNTPAFGYQSQKQSFFLITPNPEVRENNIRDKNNNFNSPHHRLQFPFTHNFLSSNENNSNEETLRSARTTKHPTESNLFNDFIFPQSYMKRPITQSFDSFHNSRDQQSVFKYPIESKKPEVKTATVVFSPPKRHVQTHRDIDNSIPTRTHFKAVLVEDPNKPISHPFRHIINNGNGNAHSSSIRQTGRKVPENVHFNNAISGQRPLRPRQLIRAPSIGLGNMFRVVNAPTNGRIVKPQRQRGPFNSRSQGLVNFMIPPPKRRNRQQRIPFQIRNARKRPNDLTFGQETRNSVLLAQPSSQFIRTSQFNAGGHKHREVLKEPHHENKRIQNIVHTSNSPGGNDNSLSSFQRHIRSRPQIVLNSRPPITSLPNHLQLLPSSSVRHARHSGQLSKPPSVFGVRHKNAPNMKIPNLRNTVRDQTAKFEPVRQSNRIADTNSLKQLKSMPKSKVPQFSSFPHRPFFQRLPIPSSSHVYTVRDNLSNENNIDIAGISQPLPHQMLLKSSHNKMAESHISLLKNLEFGVNGEPLDVWIPMKSEKSKYKCINLK